VKSIASTARPIRFMCQLLVRKFNTTLWCPFAGGKLSVSAGKCNVIIAERAVPFRCANKIRTYPIHFREETNMSISSTTEKLIARKENGIGWVIFNNPEKRNAMSPDMVDAMRAALEDYATDSAVRVVILKGQGTKLSYRGQTFPSSARPARRRNKCERRRRGRSLRIARYATVRNRRLR
jgi:Enoyl-CoA hydratase/isomerase